MLFFRTFLMLETIVEIIGNQFLIKKHFPASGKHFLWFYFQKKQFFCIEETYFSTNATFRVVETDFLASTNRFLYIFSETPTGESFFSVQWKLVFERILHSGYWRRIFLSNGDRYFTWKFSSTSENCHCYESKPIFKSKTYSCLKPIFVHFFVP